MYRNISLIPIQYKWKFSEEALKRLSKSEAKRGIPRGCISGFAKTEEIPGVEYQIFLKSSTKNNVFYFSPMFALYNPKDRRIRGTFAFYIKSANYSSSFQSELFVHKSRCYGSDVCSFEDLFDPEKKFIVNGECRIEVKGVFYLEEIPDKYEPKQTLAKYLWNRDDHDFTIVVGKENESKTEIKVHKFVLAARSRIFDAMLYTNMKEKAESKVAIIDFNVQTVKNAIAFCYDQNYGIPYNSITDATSLFQFSDKYDIQDLKDELEQHLVTIAAPENICEITNAAVITNSYQLGQFCVQKMLVFSKMGIPIENIEILDNDFPIEFMKKTISHKK